MIVPIENAQEAAVVKGIEVFGVGSLAQAIGFLTGVVEIEPVYVEAEDLLSRESGGDYDFSDVRGQESVKRALTIAAAGGHNVIMLCLIPLLKELTWQNLKNALVRRMQSVEHK